MRVLGLVCFAVPLWGASASAKETVEPFGAGYDTQESENFAVHWQPELVAIDDATALALAGDLEDAFATFHGAMGYWLPLHSDALRMNAYVATAASTPSIDGYGAFASFAADGTPYMVIAVELITQQDPGLRFVLAHEYFHAIQFAVPAFSALPPPPAVDTSSWWFEATANWAATQIDPADPTLFLDIAHYLVATELPLFVSSLDLPFDSDAQAHEYGAMLFPMFVGAEAVRDSWSAGADASPLDVLDVADELHSFARAIADGTFAPSDQAMIDDVMPDLDLFGPHVELVTLRAGPDPGEVDPPAARALHGYGFHVVEVTTGDAPLELRLRVDDAGSEGTAAEWTASARVDGQVVSVPTGADPAPTLSLPANAGPLRVVVSCVPAATSLSETFSYRVVLAPSSARDEPGAHQDGDDDAGGCSAGAVPPELALALLCLAPRGRRRAAHPRARSDRARREEERGRSG